MGVAYTIFASFPVPARDNSTVSQASHLSLTYINFSKSLPAVFVAKVFRENFDVFILNVELTF